MCVPVQPKPMVQPGVSKPVPATPPKLIGQHGPMVQPGANQPVRVGPPPTMPIARPWHRMEQGGKPMTGRSKKRPPLPPPPLQQGGPSENPSSSSSAAPAAVCPGPKPLPPVRGFAGKENEGHLYVSSMAIPQEYSFVLFGFLFFNVLIHVSDCWISMYTIPHKLNFQTCSFCLSKALFGSRRAYERCVRDQKCKRGGEKKQKGNGNGKGRGKRSKGAGKDQ